MRRHGYKSSLLNLCHLQPVWPQASCFIPTSPFSLLIRLADKVRWGLKKIKCTEPWASAYCSGNVAAIIIVFVSPKTSRERTLDNFKALLWCLLNACTEVGTPASTLTGGSQSGSRRGDSTHLAGSSPRPRPLSHSPAPPCHIPLFPGGWAVTHMVSSSGLGPSDPGTGLT